VIKSGQNRFVWAGMLVVALILIYTAFSERGLLKVRQLMNDRDSIRAEIKLTSQENERLALEAKALSDDMMTIEKAARQQLDLVKENEILYKFGNR